MGKKSVVDGSFMESAFEDVNVPAEVRPVSPLRTVEDLQALLILMLETAQRAHEIQALKCWFILLLLLFVLLF